MKRLTTNLNEEDDGVTKALNLVFVDISTTSTKTFECEIIYLFAMMNLLLGGSIFEERYTQRRFF